MKTTWGEGTVVDGVEARMVEGARAAAFENGLVWVSDDGTVWHSTGYEVRIDYGPSHAEQDQRTARRKEQMVAGLGLMTFGWEDGGAVKLPHDFVAAFRADLGLGPRPAEEDDGA